MASPDHRHERVVSERKLLRPVLGSMEGLLLDHAALNGNCGICLRRVKLGDALKRLECSHAYHGGCMFQWIQWEKPHCLVCGYKLNAKDIGRMVPGEKDQRRRLECLEFLYGVPLD